MTAIRETCPCGARIHVKHPDPAPIAAQWRDSHPCDRRAAGEREVTGAATVETAYTEPHRTDSQVRQSIGFRVDLDSKEIARAIDRMNRRAHP